MRSNIFRFSLAVIAITAWLFVAPSYANDAGAPVEEAAEVEAAPAATAPAAEVTIGDSVKDAVGQGKSIKDSFMSGNKREGVAGAILLLIFLWRRFASKLLIGKMSSYQVGLLTAGIAFATNLAAELMAVQFNWYTFVINGAVTAGEAMLFWEIVGQKALPKIFGKPKEA